MSAASDLHVLDSNHPNVMPRTEHHDTGAWVHYSHQVGVSWLRSHCVPFPSCQFFLFLACFTHSKTAPFVRQVLVPRKLAFTLMICNPGRPQNLKPTIGGTSWARFLPSQRGVKHMAIAHSRTGTLGAHWNSAFCASSYCRLGGGSKPCTPPALK